MQQKLKVLLADDDPVFLRLLPRQLSGRDLEISTTSSGQSVIDVLTKREFDVVVLDIGLPDISGLEVLKKLKQVPEGPEVIMLTGDASLESGLSAMRDGAYDYVTKPAEPEHIFELINKAADKTRILKENARLKVAAGSQSTSVRPIYSSGVMEKLFQEAEKVARLDTTILVNGESGTGKDVIANWIHSKSGRATEPIVSVNCGAIPENLVEAEFFGFEKGAFTGAAKQKVGLIEAADGSTLFLDEIGEMPLSLQVKLLRFLETGDFRRVGSIRDLKADVRIIAATNKDLENEISVGNFRSDLFYRLNVLRFSIPPLRERVEDAKVLAEHFLEFFGSKYGFSDLNFTAAAISQISQYKWPGNVRELKNAIERTVALSDNPSISYIHGLASTVPSQPQQDLQEPISLADLERTHIERVLAAVEGNREKAATILGITSRTLYRKLNQYKQA